MIDLAAQLEGILFYLTKPISSQKLAEIVDQDEDKVVTALETLRGRLEGRGVVLLEHGGEFSLGTHPDLSDLLDEFTQRDQETPLSKAALETLAIILYRGPVAKPVIDYIRGVNSQFMLRALLLRGLVEKVPNPEDARGNLYQVTQDSLQFLGITNPDEAPNYTELRTTLDTRMETANESTS